jgi:hypothetical protein
MWIVDGQLGRAAADIQLDTKDEISQWAEGLANAEAQRLNSIGLRALPLKVRQCGPLSMMHVGRKPKDVQRITFNKASLATTFDFGQVLSMETGSMEDDTFTSADGTMYFCVICLLRIGCGSTKAPIVDGKEMVMIFPFVFKDPLNLLSHWALVNSKEQPHYIVRENMRAGSSVVPGQKGVEPLPPRVSGSNALSQQSHNESIRKEACMSSEMLVDRIRQEWAKQPLKQRTGVLTFDDPKIFHSTLATISVLFGRSCEPTVIAKKMQAFPLLCSIEFQRKSIGPAVMSISCSILQDNDAFFQLLQVLCPKMFSGKTRRRRNPSEWSALFESPCKDAERLQQRIAQLIEQKLWTLADTLACEQPSAPGRKRPRRRNKCSHASSGEAQCQSIAEPLSVVQDKTEAEEVALPEDPCAHSPDQVVQSDSGVMVRGIAEPCTVDVASDDKLIEALDAEETCLLKECFSKPCPLSCEDIARPTGSIANEEAESPPDTEQTSSAVINAAVEASLHKVGQPPGLELDDVTLIQRVKQLNQQLQWSGLKVPLVQLMTDALLGA